MASEVKLLFFFSISELRFGGIIDAEGKLVDDDDEDELKALSKKLYKKHQEIFNNPKDENIGFSTDLVREELIMWNDNILDARVLKWGLSLEDAPAACIYDHDEFISLNKTFFAFIEITYNGEINDDSFYRLYGHIDDATTRYTFKVGGYEFLTLGDQPEHHVSVELVGDEYWEELGFTAEYEPEIKELLESIRTEGAGSILFVKWK